MCHFTNGESWNETSAFVVGRLRDFRLSLRRPLCCFFWTDRSELCYIRLTSHRRTTVPTNFAISPSATTIHPVNNVSTNALRIARECRRFRHVECLRDL